MNFTHLHLLLNHFPIIGTMVGVGLFLISFFLGSEGLRQGSLIVFLTMALLTIPTFVTGMGAQVQMLEGQTDISDAMIQRHLGSAELSLWFIFITGGLAVIELWQTRGLNFPRRGNTFATLIFSLLTVGLMARTGNTGGEIRHPEVRVDQSASEVDTILAAVEPSPHAFTQLMIASKWWWAFMMDLHFIGLVLLIGTVGLMDLRVMGFAKRLPIAPLNKLVPWGLAGFGINVVTGMLAFIGMSSYYTFNIAFMLKIVAILLAVATLGLFYMTSAFRDCLAVGPGQDAPLRAKVIAAASLLLWFAVLVLGRYIQPLENTIPH